MAVLTTLMAEGTSVIVTVASSLSLTAVPSLSAPAAVTVSFSTLPGTPVTLAEKEQE